jgi:DNA-binding response OmpR family regulator
MRLLLVEDDRMLGELVQIGLRQDSYAVDWVRDAEQGLSATLTHPYEAILLDLGLPRSDAQLEHACADPDRTRRCRAAYSRAQCGCR